MADQASVRGAGFAGPGAGRAAPNGRGNGHGMVGSVAEVVHDVTTLAELQAKLTALDLKESAERMAVPAVVVGTALVLVLGAVPVALLGLADLLTMVLRVSPGTARLIVAAFALAVAGLLVFASLRSLERVREPLRRSREEFERNLAWVKTVLVHSGRSNPRRRL